MEITDEPVGEVRSRFYARAPELHRSPVFAVAVVRETVGDRLLLNFHHAAFDGMGGLRLLLSLARAYAGEPDEVGGPPIEEARNLKGVAGSRDLFDVLIRARGLAKPAIDRKRTTRVAPDGGSPDGPRFVFAPLTIESDEMATAVARRPEGATVNDLAMAALALTILQWNRTHDVPAADSVSVNMPVNFRPTAWSTEVISNFASYLAIVLRVDEVTDLEKATAIVAGITGPLKQSGAAGWVVDLLEGGKVLPAMLKRQLQLLLPLVEDRFVESVCLSNLGRVDVPAFGGEAGDTTEVWFSPTAAMSVMPIGVGLVGFGGTLRAMFRGDGRTIGGEALGRFAALYRDTLLT
ncbi:acyltransferase%2C WS/DGAT/MGAT [Mycobacterium tuberculosis]|uniref:Acyltransferase, WS/DGAT/MGAT n=1 Tax=Mycobacterium tuberculosis TaxID=1773 RepID=A0A0T9Y6Q7_MYCTX|nr:hypothetical protein [Mycobacterium tuberculosis]CFR92270.1 acyltransferase%2C WS/DGAT/MGAT [Mycobacterium tuberculosis]CKN48055.1 acyltransferase%2C WS/DGAT/MGAT [Mycobacterium tuberculosis]CKN88256.1 acyltransferase%2C WS/DGAT/MGAT [Mycobacterium tuberculosis]CNV19226.1 acyltransferase%2C WS/DGAT/MGAT [Mycobacterium tuberculosis]